MGNVDQHSLLLAPAERADAVVDFSKFAGKTLILYNDAPAAFPARVPQYDYYTGAPDLSPTGAPTIHPGYGPNTRTVMQVTIADTAPAPAFDLPSCRRRSTTRQTAPASSSPASTRSIVGQAAYNSAYGACFAASSNCNAQAASRRSATAWSGSNDTGNVRLQHAAVAATQDRPCRWSRRRSTTR